MPHDPLLLYYLTAALIAWPTGRICQRMKVNTLWCAALLLPMFGYIILMGAIAIRGRKKKEFA